MLRIVHIFLAGISHISVENKQHEVNDEKNKTGLIAGPKTIFYGKERGSIGTRTVLAFPSEKADFVDKGVKL